ncbi:unnamed protein product [Phytomonas sp. Hart1]|nr:unnamed protein product [Phytomonas sp. Hart1]|eukprot:CCW70286.1 unnamed protein product [Phytomonas sp. isolate Hart1]
MGFKYIEKDFCISSDTKDLLNEELEEAESGSDPRTQLFLRKEGVQYLSELFPHIKHINDLDTLSQNLKAEDEFAFSQVFDSKLIDACIIRGIFPLSLDIGRNIFLFAPKLHKLHLICATVDNYLMRNNIEYFPRCNDNEGIFQVEKLNISKRFLKLTNDALYSVSFDIFVNRKEDLVDVFCLIHQRYGENWLCKALRKCFLYMHLHRENFETQIITIAVRRHKYQSDSRQLSSSSSDEVKEGDLVAAEIGYIVGDIYTSATGAYCVSGAGKLQLAVTGCILHKLGCKVWDLGMSMFYKNSLLGCVEIKRENWIQMVKQHRQNSVLVTRKSQEFLLELQKGKCVGAILKDSTKQLQNQ